MSPKRPTVVLIPGSFQHSSHYTSTLEPLLTAGISVHILDPPCYYSKKPPPLPTMQSDADYISTFLTNLADNSEEILLVAHSYGGIPASQCLRDLTLSQRAAAGKPGGVVRIAYITAVVPACGQGLAETMVGGVQVPLEADPDGWLFQPQPEETAAVCLNALSLEEGLKEVRKMGVHSSAAFAGVLEYPGYKYLPVSWFLCERDRCITSQVQEQAIRTVEESWRGTAREGRKVDVKRVDCDHFPTLSARGELVGWLKELVEKGAEE